MGTTRANQTLEMMRSRAKEWDRKRRYSAVSEFKNYRLLPNGTLQNLITREFHAPDESKTISNKKGVFYIGCDCKDEEGRLCQLRANLAEKGEGCMLHCKHAYIRQLLMGRTVRIDRTVYRIKAALLGAQK